MSTPEPTERAGHEGEGTAKTKSKLLRITWIGHSTVLLELDGTRLLTDPVLRRRLAHLRRVGARAQPDALGEVDAVLLSHMHYDHLDLPSLRRLGRSTHLVVPADAGKLLRRVGFERVTELDVGDETRVGSVEIRATPAEHDGRRRPMGPKIPALGYLVTGSGRVYFAGDTDLFDGMSALAPGLDVALLPVAGWGPTVPPGHLDARRAAEALGLLRPRVAVPIHWGTYRMVGLSGAAALLREPPESFVRHARELAPDVDVRLVPVGGSLELPVPAPRGARA
jgi:L-ascorbate metabolism protein UlaG (beta-lactamase superfamily)